MYDKLTQTYVYRLGVHLILESALFRANSGGKTILCKYIQSNLLKYNTVGILH